MENLNKENFWNDMMQKYPQAMEQFCKWIDAYKNKNNWDKLFNAGVEVFARAWDGNGYDKTGGETIAPKFHHLPIEMQAGIWQAFLFDFELDPQKKSIEHVLNVRQTEFNSAIAALEKYGLLHEIAGRMCSDFGNWLLVGGAETVPGGNWRFNKEIFTTEDLYKKFLNEKTV